MKARSLWQSGGNPTPALPTMGNVANTMGNVSNTVGNTMGNVANTMGNTMGNVGNTMGNVANTMGNVANTMGNAAGTVKQTIQANPHYSLFALPLVIYGLIALYMNLITKKTGLKEYVAFIYLSFLLLLLGYSRYCTSKLTSQGGGMIFMIASYLMVTSVAALIFFLYKVLTYKEDTPTQTTSR